MARKGNPISVRLDLRGIYNKAFMIFMDPNSWKFLVLMLQMGALILVIGDFGAVAACDEGVASDGLPVVRIQVQEARELHPAPPEIPVLDHPLLPDIQREDELYRRFVVNTIGEYPSLERITETVRVQSLVERQVEAALVHHGFPPSSIILNRHLIRGFLFYHRGRALSTRTYLSYLHEISRLGTRDTRAFQRILRAIQNSELFL